MQEFKIKVLIEGKPGQLKIRNDFSEANQIEIVQEINKQMGNYKGLKLFIKESLKTNCYYLGSIPSNCTFHVDQQEIINNKYKILLQKGFEIQKVTKKAPRRTIKQVRMILGEIEGQNSKSQMGTKVATFNNLCEQISERTSTVRQYVREFEFGKIFYFDFDFHEDSKVGVLYKYNFRIKEFILNNIQNGKLQSASTKQLIEYLQVNLQETHFNCCLNSVNFDLKKLKNLQEEIDRLVKKPNNKTKVQIASQKRNHQSQQVQALNNDLEQLQVQNIASQVRQYQKSSANNIKTCLNIDQMYQQLDLEIESQERSHQSQQMQELNIEDFPQQKVQITTSKFGQPLQSDLDSITQNLNVNQNSYLKDVGIVD